MADAFHLLLPLLPLKRPFSGWGCVPGHPLIPPPMRGLQPAVLQLMPDLGWLREWPSWMGSPESTPPAMLSSAHGPAEEVEMPGSSGDTYHNFSTLLVLN